ncbi:hypothetical protein [Ostreiculturibacter nitratireducens]|uniref:hypothetical protein n=1 Tax=Ostreiculturibacter nitratireducens TaxID=3075226 RepID=UPI0031B5EB99
MTEMTMGSTGTRGTSVSLPLIAVAAALLAFLGMEVTAFLSTGGYFEYPLDDVYIHLSMAEEIARGGYGINEGEFASAASSPLYPFLLTPFAGTEAHRFLPVAWNAVGLILAAFLWGRTLALAGYGRMTQAWPGIALAALGPLAVNAYGLAYTGMEHTLHLAATLAIVCGLTRFVIEGRIGPALLLGVFFSPAFRLEGLALALSAAGMVAVLGRWRAGFLLGFAALIPALAFVGFLLSLGLDPLPNSVNAKLALPGTEEYGLPARFLATMLLNLTEFPGWIILGLSLLSLASAPLLGAGGRNDLRLFCYAIGFSGLAHMGLGLVGWLNRYEIYILGALVLGLAAILGLAGANARGCRPIAAIFAVLTLAGGSYYLVTALQSGRWASLGIHLQQGQMARFAQDFAHRPVAVNDIGRVAWGNPHYVLDLWGLASDEARQLRLTGDDPRWVGTLAAEHGVGVAMVYDSWVGDYVGEDWVKLGSLDLRIPRAVLGGWVVTFYATSPELVPELTEALREFAPTLPDRSVFTFAEPRG